MAREARAEFSTSECESDATPILPQRAVAVVDEDSEERSSSDNEGQSHSGSRATPDDSAERSSACNQTPSGDITERSSATQSGDTLVTADSGNNRFWLSRYVRTPARRTYFGSGGVGAMGWAAPAAVSAELAGYDAICVAGDGGFTMTMTAVETAVEYRIAPTFVMLNDTGLGMVRQMDADIPRTTFHDTDFVRVAEGFGANGERIDEPERLDDALREDRRADQPSVLDVRIDPTVEMAETLQSSFYAETGGLHE